MDDIYKTIEKYNPNKERKIFVIFDDMIADILSNKKLKPLVTELFIRGRNIIFIFLIFIIRYPTLLYKKNIRLSFTHYFNMKIPKKRELQQIAFCNLNFYKKCNAKPYSFLQSI